MSRGIGLAQSWHIGEAIVFISLGHFIARLFDQDISEGIFYTSA
jgi:hypothetical protein